MTAIYWGAQAVFVASFFFMPLVPDGLTRSSDLVMLGLAAIQFGLVSWRLWTARSWPWLALVPPLSTAALWFGLSAWAAWAARDVGGDGAGLLAGMATLAWGLVSYIGVGVWAGLQRPQAR